MRPRLASPARRRPNSRRSFSVAIAAPPKLSRPRPHLAIRQTYFAGGDFLWSKPGRDMKITREEANTIAEWLGSDDLDKLLNAKETLGELGPDAVTVLRAFAHKDAGRYRAGRRRLWCLSALTVTLCFCLLLGQVIKVWHVSDAAPFLLMSVWLTAPFFLAWYDSHRTCQKRLNHTTVLLRRMMPVSAICELIEVME